ncbi:hypothetical protein B0H10DRAFT_1815190, partial [Mycena sp. CBHHK59/15]
SITCDNASANDAMAHALESRLIAFDAQKDRTRCFDHIMNLVAKSLLKMFDPPPKNSFGNSDDADDTDGDRDDEDPSGGLDLDELLAELDDMERTEEDDDADIFDEIGHMLEAEREEFLEQTKEIRSALIKVRMSYDLDMNTNNQSHQVRSLPSQPK